MARTNHCIFCRSTAHVCYCLAVVYYSCNACYQFTSKTWGIKFWWKMLASLPLFFKFAIRYFESLYPPVVLAISKVSTALFFRIPVILERWKIRQKEKNCYILKRLSLWFHLFLISRSVSKLQRFEKERWILLRLQVLKIRKINHPRKLNNFCVKYTTLI